ncbi:hypothetical protein TcCL_NonESM00397 [Trypanosoma cruzi]|uniref:Uncharacterized protein n=1 Tax=Trypanosoma cruzi (strain CL Brener) TaxID=353153 RepID=Q4DQA8_TRYCC|nr:hypothetical protein Tc00.1047053511827.115 [Trypanosoma cruzi]EAN94722.1 hypothetical protein Tc00.1047053511827.115 [Trypanosoma cruzi]RNC49534.1 hypothetical protein TcCL_NonESM00397 [Trypanosoma cruzi]|eukprot:XP_816573.1 hypothetical protein [Trypanosoma cruzi strain CL Brener]
MKRRKEGSDNDCAPWLSSSVGKLHGVRRYFFEAPHHHARGHGTEWKTSFWFCVCCCGCGCIHAGIVGTMTVACGCHFVLLENMLPRLYVCVVSGTMCRRLCDCRMEGEEWRELRERRGQESRWVSRRGGHCPPSPAPLLPGILYHSAASYSTPPARSEAADAATATSATGRDTSAVVFRGGNPCGTAACPQPHRGLRAQDTGHWPRSVCVVEDTAAASLFLQVDGRLFLLFFPPGRIAAR